MNKIICEMKHIDKLFPGTQALNDVEFTIRAGEIHALIGTNGSGKSTLSNILAGTFQQSRGEIIVNGEKVTFNQPSQAMDMGIVLIHQELKLMPEMTVAENIFFGRFQRYTKYPVINWKETNRQASTILHELGSNIDPTIKVSALSIAEMQLVEIAKALSKEAKILIMDEPTASLTFEEVRSLFKVMKDLKRKGLAIIYISHRLEEILEMADRITVLEDSKLVTSIENSPNLTKEHLVRLMMPKEKKMASQRLGVKEVDRPVKLSARNICYKNKVTNFSFELKYGEVLGIAGLMGSGRTELLKCIFGAHSIKSGEFYLNGKPYKPKSPVTSLNNRIALISEDRKREGLVLSMSITDNMLFPNFRSYSFGPFIKNKMAKKDVKFQADNLNLRYDKLHAFTRSLSGGNQQKVIVAREFNRPIKLLVASQPTRGLDVGSVEYIHRQILEKRNQGCAVLLVSSELDEIMALSDRIAVMYRGKIVDILPAAQATKEGVGLLMAGVKPTAPLSPVS